MNTIALYVILAFSLTSLCVASITGTLSWICLECVSNAFIQTHTIKIALCITLIVFIGMEYKYWKDITCRT